MKRGLDGSDPPSVRGSARFTTPGKGDDGPVGCLPRGGRLVDRPDPGYRAEKGVGLGRREEIGERDGEGDRRCMDCDLVMRFISFMIQTCDVRQMSVSLPRTYGRFDGDDVR